MVKGVHLSAQITQLLVGGVKLKLQRLNHLILVFQLRGQVLKFRRVGLLMLE